MVPPPRSGTTHQFTPMGAFAKRSWARSPMIVRGAELGSRAFLCRLATQGCMLLRSRPIYCPHPKGKGARPARTCRRRGSIRANGVAIPCPGRWMTQLKPVVRAHLEGSRGTQNGRLHEPPALEDLIAVEIPVTRDHIGVRQLVRYADDVIGEHRHQGAAVVTHDPLHLSIHLAPLVLV